MITIGLTGANGQLGLCIMDAARTAGDIHITPITRDDFDLNDPLSVEKTVDLLRGVKCNVLVNSAAYTAVDGAEADIASAYTINEKSPNILAAACAILDIPIIHISTDYVFNGRQTEPYIETDTPDPLSVYGKSKYAGEVAIRAAHKKSVIIRSAWLFSAYRKNFLKTMLILGQQKSSLSIVADQVGTPTYASDLAHGVLAVVRAITQGRDVYGTYHYGGYPDASWYDFAVAIFDRARAFGLTTPSTITAIPTSSYPLPARRPMYSVLSSTLFAKIFGLPPSDWRSGIDETLSILQSTGEINHGT